MTLTSAEITEAQLLAGVGCFKE
ncbi:uncharacterized protein METZ01_LOCUS2194 [marine metagenome]|uniref:Uncharacterized protein n=1 Tax=marine metagenome TaxID=408172 RepID=A0A381N3Z5_9ZZZZ